MENVDIVQLVQGVGGGLGTLLVSIVMLWKIMQTHTHHIENQKAIEKTNEKITEHLENHRHFSEKIVQNSTNIEKLSIIVEKHEKDLAQHEKQIKNLKQYKSSQ